MTPQDIRIRELEESKRQLTERVEELEHYIRELLEDVPEAAFPFMTRTEARLMVMLMERKACTRNSLHHATMLDNGKETEPKLIDVYICRMRRKLRETLGLDDVIDTFFASGYGIEEANKARVEKAMEAYRNADPVD
jgi:two-component system cell cycle response regulator CtrA